MSRSQPPTHAKDLTLAIGGRIAELAAERCPPAAATMSQGARAAHWLGEYINAMRQLPHLKASEVLALIHEHDEKAGGATFTRTIKRLAHEHTATDKPVTVAATRRTRAMAAMPSPAARMAAVQAAPTAEQTAPPEPASSSSPYRATTAQQLSLDDHAATRDTDDVQARLQRLRATVSDEGFTGEHQA